MEMVFDEYYDNDEDGDGDSDSDSDEDGDEDGDGDGDGYFRDEIIDGNYFIGNGKYFVDSNGNYFIV